VRTGHDPVLPTLEEQDRRPYLNTRYLRRAGFDEAVTWCFAGFWRKRGSW
jgi:hypothetical protein